MFEPAGRVYALPALTINFLGTRRRRAVAPGSPFLVTFLAKQKSDRLPGRTRLASTKSGRCYARNVAIGHMLNGAAKRALHPHPNLPPASIGIYTSTKRLAYQCLSRAGGNPEMLY
jgi:hypothetical protein